MTEARNPLPRALPEALELLAAIEGATVALKRLAEKLGRSRGG